MIVIKKDKKLYFPNKIEVKYFSLRAGMGGRIVQEGVRYLHK